MAMTSARPSSRDEIGDGEILVLDRALGIDQQHHDLGEADRANAVARAQELLGCLRHPGFAAQTGRIEEAHLAPRPFEVAGDRVARQPRLGSRDHALLAEEGVDQRRLAGVGAPDDGNADGPRRTSLKAGIGLRLVRRLAALPDDRLQAQRRQHIGHEVDQAFAVLGRDGDRLAEAQLESGVEARLPYAPLALIGDDDNRAPRGAHELGEHLVARRHAFARIDQEQHEIGLGERRLGLLAHALGDRPAFCLLEARRIDDRDGVAGEIRLARAAVARQPRHIGDEGRALARQTVEQRRLADVGPADDGDDGCGHR